MKKTLSPARKLTEFLRGRESASYAQMSKHVGKQINGADRTALYTALKNLRKDGLTFEVERGVGYRRASAVAANEPTEQAAAKVKRVARRSAKVPGDNDVLVIGRLVIQTLDATVGPEAREKIVDAARRNGVAF